MARPEKSEYPEYYHSYVSKSQGDNAVKVLEDSNAITRKLFKNVEDEKGAFAYAEGKWTLNELVQHLIDSERVFAYRLMRIARNDKTPMPGFEQDDYVPESNANNKNLSELLIEANVLRN
ncbi:MAG: DinB family protein, partial [Bacteroidia bacterium]|nr:DinB family protein [Bacteroidia bacterium]